MEEKNADGTGLEKVEDSQLEEVAGGYLYCEQHDGDERHWQVLDRNGNVVERFVSYYDAFYWAQNNGYTTNELNSNELAKLRETGWPW